MSRIMYVGAWWRYLRTETCECINDIIKIVLCLKVIRLSQHNGMHLTKITKDCYMNIIPFQQEKEIIKTLAL